MELSTKANLKDMEIITTGFAAKKDGKYWGIQGKEVSTRFYGYGDIESAMLILTDTHFETICKPHNFGTSKELKGAEVVEIEKTVTFREIDQNKEKQTEVSDDLSTKEKVIKTISERTPYSINETRQAFDKLKSIDKTLFAINVARQSGVPLMQIVNNWSKIFNG